jgi:hypothetical protein
VTFRLYAPSDTNCAGAPVFTDTATLTDGMAQSSSFTPIAVGTYRWVATYDGDVNNASVSGACGDATETRAVSQATPTITTQASANIVLGSGQLSDQATVSGLVNPSGPQTVTFRLFGPADPTCASTPVFTSMAALIGGTAQSASFTPTVAGTYRWVATYSGDVNNVSVSGTCGDPGENATVTAAPITLPPTGAALDTLLALAAGTVAVGALVVRITRRKIV